MVLNKFGEIIKNINFQNCNAESYFKWIFRKKETLDQVVFYFLSQTNATSPRFFPLFDASTKIRIVYIRGLKIPYTDLLMFKIWKLLGQLSSLKLSKYRYVHILGGYTNFKAENQILHLDDPNYSPKEILYLQNWEKKLTKMKLKPVIICTNKHTYKYLNEVTRHTRILIIEQGFDLIQNPKNSETDIIDPKLSCVYSSPYIHADKDKHAKHGTWGAELLIDTIIPLMNLTDPDIEIHLVGEIGKCAKNKLKNFNNIVYYGRVGFKENLRILSNCSIGIYPRDKDFKRSMSKIFSYIGAGLPIVTFDLIDTEVVKENNLGYSVKSSEEFVEKIVFLKNNREILEDFHNRVNLFKPNYSWQKLSHKMEAYLK
jgi:glycosyltransferase involved in cell wall biosynthesis